MSTFYPDPSLGQTQTPEGFYPDPSLNQNKNGITPDQSAMALGHSNGLTNNMIGSAGQSTGKQSFGTDMSQIGNFAGTIANSALQFAQSAVHAPSDIVNGLQGKGPDTSTMPNFTGEGQQTIQGQSAQTASDVFEGKTSPLAGTLKSVGTTIGGALNFLGGGKAASEAAPAFKEAVDATAKGTEDFLARNAEKKATQTTIKALTPKMTPTELEEAAKSGQAVRPRFGTPKIDQTTSSGFMKMVGAVKGIVKGKSAIQDTNAVRNALSTEAESLKSKVVASGADKIYPFQELASKISSADEPISLKGTPFEKQIAPLKKAAIQIAQKNGGTISSLFDTRKEFDELVNKTWPTLWDKENAPMRTAVATVRNTMNDFIESSLPETGYKDSLELQKQYYNAIDNITSKIPDEIKSGGLPQKIGRLAKKAGVAALVGASGAIGAGGVYEAGKDLFEGSGE